jgi:hypothetical protein
MSPGRPLRPGSVAGDLLELEGWYYIEDFDVRVDFLVTWRHPVQGIGGVYRPGGSGFDGDGGFGPVHLAFLADATVLDDAELDFAHDGAYFARDLRIAPVRDTTAPETYATLGSGAPYPRRSGLSAARRGKAEAIERLLRRKS